MPQLDVSFLTTDPDFSEALTIIRRTQSAGSNGRAITTETEIIPAPFGVVTPGAVSPVYRAAEYESAGDAISVCTNFVLRSAQAGHLPDILVWRGSRYYVQKIMDYSQFGAGFVVAECGLIDPVNGMQ